MKRLGLIGGMSWESTRLYYDVMNRLVRERLGGSHSAELLLWSFDFEPIVQMQSAGQWDRAAALLAEAARRLEAAGAQALLICANTMHRMAGEVQAAVQVPLIHVADVTAAEVRARRSRRPLLLATRYTMEQDFYRARLASRGVEVLVPDEPDRVRLQAIIYEELVRGVVRPQSKAELLRMVGAAQRDAGADGVVLACTELGLLLGPGDVEAPVFDTTEIHARAGVDFALA